MASCPREGGCPGSVKSRCSSHGGPTWGTEAESRPWVGSCDRSSCARGALRAGLSHCYAQTEATAQIQHMCQEQYRLENKSNSQFCF